MDRSEPGIWKSTWAGLSVLILMGYVAYSCSTARDAPDLLGEGVPWEWISADGAYDVTVLRPASNPESDCAWLVRVDVVVWSTDHLGSIPTAPFAPGDEFELLGGCEAWPAARWWSPPFTARVVTVSTMRVEAHGEYDADQANLTVTFDPLTMRPWIDGDPPLAWLADSVEPSRLTDILTALLDELATEFESGTNGPLLTRVAEWRLDHPRYLTDAAG